LLTHIRRLATLLATLLALSLATGAAAAEPQHYIFFNLDRQRIHETSFLYTPAIAGAQLKYTWKELEPQRGVYALAPVLADLAFLAEHHKQLVLQLQDASFDERMNVPDYLVADSAFHGGAARKYEAQDSDSEAAAGADTAARFDGWVARRWDPAVAERFRLLLDVLGRELDGRIAALVLSETAIEFGGGERHRPAGFTFAGYAEAVKRQMSAARTAFTRSPVIQYANFMPGEWLPRDDHGYLRGLYAHADSIGAGMGGPDLMPHRKELLNHSYPLLAAKGNLAARDPLTGQPVSVPELAAFARDSLRLDFVFWGTQEPYYTRDVLTWLRAQPAAAEPR
jgi:hypothetical protein